MHSGESLHATQRRVVDIHNPNATGAVNELLHDASL
jgi:hypothetical protein